MIKGLEMNRSLCGSFNTCNTTSRLVPMNHGYSCFNGFVSGFVLEVEGGLTANARLIVNKSAISPDEDKADEQIVVEVEKDEDEMAHEEVIQTLLSENT